MIYAIDFDGTLCKKNWPRIGEPNRELISFLLGERQNGAELILWTMREGKALDEAIAWCAEQGLVFDAVNDNMERCKQEWNNNPRKVYADWYIDDHNMPAWEMMHDIPLRLKNPTEIIFHTMNNQKGSVSMESNTERHKRVCYELNALYDKKNRDYGDSFHETFKQEGMAMSRIRLMDKLNRFCTLTRGQNAPNIASETVRDTLLDLANYTIMTLMELDAEDTPPWDDPAWTKEN